MNAEQKTHKCMGCGNETSNTYCHECYVKYVQPIVRGDAKA